MSGWGEMCSSGTEAKQRERDIRVTVTGREANCRPTATQRSVKQQLCQILKGQQGQCVGVCAASSRGQGCTTQHSRPSPTFASMIISCILMEGVTLTLAPHTYPEAPTPAAPLLLLAAPAAAVPLAAAASCSAAWLYTRTKWLTCLPQKVAGVKSTDVSQCSCRLVQEDSCRKINEHEGEQEMPEIKPLCVDAALGRQVSRSSAH